MSESMRRKSSSRQLLQNLIRVTAQRSQEDAEEVERERRRRARERQRGEEGPSWPEPPQHHELPHDTELDEELKPSCCSVLEEDEGFSDWSHRLENRSTDQEVPEDCRTRVQRSSTSQWKPEPAVEKQQDQEEGCHLQQSHCPPEAPTRPSEKMSCNRKEGRTSFSSSVFLPQDVRLPDRTSYLVAGTMKPRGGACRLDGEVRQEEQREVKEVHPGLQREWRPRQSHRDEDDEEEEEEEELKFTHEEKEEEEEREEEKLPSEWSVESRSSEEMNRRSTVSVCSSEGDELQNCYGPMSPTFKKLLIQFYPDEANSRTSTDSKIIERTESLRKSSGSIKKTSPPVPVSRINKKLERYTQALEVSSKDSRPGGQALTDLTSPAEPVSSKKNLFEGGDAWNQSSISVTPSKDADGLKVGVADLINQWVRGSEDASRCSSPFRPAVSHYLNLNNLCFTNTHINSQLVHVFPSSESSTGKRYKFVVTGHGKYEKVSVDQDCSEDPDCQSGGHFYEDL
ncbi:lymphocyte-specific protein 1-like isoform X3 [Xyrichtys novacula]|uniref:Lymphocyte-specific protein 1-like isoform X3 n=1 Tax=Xyrichtys novacula TaxID=13765 RepID=A0AAV1EMU8_XYRNO|nr:lymphocyte-specific protein 1-like isoform X3 [Xyrichtys novacula]